MWEKEDTVSFVKDLFIVSLKSDFLKGTLCKIKYGKQVLEVKKWILVGCNKCIGQFLPKVLRVSLCKGKLLHCRSIVFLHTGQKEELKSGRGVFERTVKRMQIRTVQKMERRMSTAMCRTTEVSNT